MRQSINTRALLLAVILMFAVLGVSLLPALAATAGGSVTNIPDTDIGGATGGLNTADITLPPAVTPGSDSATAPGTAPGTDGGSMTRLPEATSSPATDSGTGTVDDDGMGIGWLGIIIVVAVVAAIIIIIVAMMPKKRDD